MSLTEQSKEVPGVEPEQTNPNLETIVGLTELAGFLSRNPDLPRVSFMVGRLDVSWSDPRPDLEAFAAAATVAGVPVKEEADSRDVVIRVEFAGNVHLDAHGSLEKLGAVVEPQVPVYEPIIPAALGSLPAGLDLPEPSGHSPHVDLGEEPSADDVR